jgi:hypothetical protein
LQGVASEVKLSLFFTLLVVILVLVVVVNLAHGQWTDQQFKNDCRTFLKQIGYFDINGKPREWICLTGIVNNKNHSAVTKRINNCIRVLESDITHGQAQS